MKEQTKLKMKDMYPEDLPYEKCERYGPEYLTDTELLCVLLRSGTKGESALSLSRRILHPDTGPSGVLSLHHWTMERLLKLKGIGKVKAVQILCIAQLAARLAKAEAETGLDFSSPETIAGYYMEDMRHKSKEEIRLILLDGRVRKIGECSISTGTVNSAPISPREIFVEALKKEAVFIILLHNHPSGDPEPSREDILVTERLKEAGALIGIELLDHIIIGGRAYVSLRERTNLFSAMPSEANAADAPGGSSLTADKAE